jgi:5-methylcytosine-specific restriction endonuclease McrA
MAKKNDPRLTRTYKKQRLAVLARDNYVCFYCGNDADTADHIIPIKEHGDPIDMQNMVACCRRCNSAKGARSEAVFLAQKATRHVFPSYTSPRTTSTVQAGPALGQPDQD